MSDEGWREAIARELRELQILDAFTLERTRCHFSQNMSSINTFNALSECLKRENERLKPHHIYIEIRVLNPHSSDEIALNLHIHGFMQSIMPHGDQPDLNEIIRNKNFSVISYRRQIPLGSQSLIVPKGLKILQDEMGKRQTNLLNLQTTREETSLEAALDNVPIEVYEEHDLAGFFAALQSAQPKAIFIDLEGMHGSAIGLSFFHFIGPGKSITGNNGASGTCMDATMDGTHSARDIILGLHHCSVGMA
jgi:hypothetical protein